MHILSPETDNCPSLISRRERMNVKIFHDKSPRKDVADLARSNPQLPDHQLDAHPTEPPRPANKDLMQFFLFYSLQFKVEKIATLVPSLEAKCLMICALSVTMMSDFSFRSSDRSVLLQTSSNKSCRRTASSPAGYILYCNIFIIKPYNIGHTDLDVFVCKSFCHIDDNSPWNSNKNKRQNHRSMKYRSQWPRYSKWSFIGSHGTNIPGVTFIQQIVFKI